MVSLFMYNLDTIQCTLSWTNEGITKQLLTGDSGNIWYVGPSNKCCPRPSASGNILSSGPTYHMLPSSPVNNCIMFLEHSSYNIILSQNSPGLIEKYRDLWPWPMNFYRHRTTITHIKLNMKVHNYNNTHSLFTLERSMLIQKCIAFMSSLSINLYIKWHIDCRYIMNKFVVK